MVEAYEKVLGSRIRGLRGGTRGVKKDGTGARILRSEETRAGGEVGSEGGVFRGDRATMPKCRLGVPKKLKHYNVSGTT